VPTANDRGRTFLVPTLRPGDRDRPSTIRRPVALSYRLSRIVAVLAAGSSRLVVRPCHACVSVVRVQCVSIVRFGVNLTVQFHCFVVVLVKTIKNIDLPM